MVRPKKPPSPSWRAFLDNHMKDLVSVDFFMVPTVAFKVLFAFVVLAHTRRRIVHFNITPSARLRVGPHSRSPKRLRGRRRRAICSGIATVYTAWPSKREWRAWASN